MGGIPCPETLYALAGVDIDVATTQRWVAAYPIAEGVVGNVGSRSGGGVAKAMRLVVQVVQFFPGAVGESWARVVERRW
jgi:hypothetical protein